MKKFPVTSASGVKYLVKVREVIADFFEVNVYLKKKALGITYDSHINYDGFGGSWYDGNTYDYDFKNMAIKEINRIELELAKLERRKNLIENNAKEFAEWDGDCR